MLNLQSDNTLFIKDCYFVRCRQDYFFDGNAGNNYPDHVLNLSNVYFFQCQYQQVHRDFTIVVGYPITISEESTYKIPCFETFEYNLSFFISALGRDLCNRPDNYPEANDDLSVCSSSPSEDEFTPSFSFDSSQDDGSSSTIIESSIRESFSSIDESIISNSLSSNDESSSSEVSRNPDEEGDLNSGGLSSTEIALIVIFSVLAGLIIIGLIIYFVWKRRKQGDFDAEMDIEDWD